MLDYAISLWYNQNVRETKNEKGDPMNKHYKATVKGKEYILTEIDYNVLLNAKVVAKEDVEEI